MPNDVDNRIDRLRQRYRQDNNLDPIYAVVGNGAGVVYDTSIAGNVFVRELTSNGLSFAKSVRGPQNTMTLYDGLNVRLLRDERRQLYVASIDNQAQAASGGNAYLTSQPPQQRVRQDLIETLSVMPDNPPSLYLSVKAWNPIVNGTYYEFPGTRVYMGPYVPPTGSMTFASIFIKSDYLTGEVGTSTPRAVSDLPLDSVDVQQTVNRRSTGAVPVQSVKLIGGQTQITLTDIQNDGKALQQLVNVADSGGGGGGTGSVTSIVAQTPLTGGTITTAGTIGLAASGVTPASYVNPTITVDSYGRVTAAAAGSGGPVIATQGTFYLRGILYDGTLSSNGVFDVSGLDQTYDHLELIVSTQDPSASSVTELTLNNDTTASHYQSQLNELASATVNGYLFANSQRYTGDPGPSDSNYWATTQTIIQNYAKTDRYKQLDSLGLQPQPTAGGAYYMDRMALIWQQTSAINRIKIAGSGGGNLIAGSRLQIFGLKAQVVVTGVSGGYVQPISTTTQSLRSEVVLYDNTLGADGSWDVSSIDQTYDDLRIELAVRSAVAGAVDNGYVNFNNDTTDANYDHQNVYGNNGTPFAGNAANRLPLTVVGNTQNANLFTPIEINIPAYASAQYKGFWNIANSIADAAGNSYSVLTSSVWKSTSAINRITISSLGGASNNFKAGSRIRIIGIKNISVVTGITGSMQAGQYILLQDQKTQNTDGGTFNSAAWQTRTLNTEVADEGNNCTLASNQFALLAGTYRIRARAPASTVGRHQIRLRNITDSTTPLTGTSEFSSSTAAYAQTESEIFGTFTIGTTKTFEIQHQCQTTAATTGFGVAANFGTEIYTSVELTKVG